jgi:hypothetical protein
MLLASLDKGGRQHASLRKTNHRRTVYVNIDQLNQSCPGIQRSYFIQERVEIHNALRCALHLFEVFQRQDHLGVIAVNGIAHSEWNALLEVL